MRPLFVGARRRGMASFVDLVREPAPAGFALPQWLEKERIVAIVDALNRGADESSDSEETEEEAG